MDCPRVCVSSARGSGGKTLLSLGLGRCLTGAGRKVKPFKKGPDYIDAAWLGLACGEPATNLDLFFTPAPDLRRLFAASLNGADFALIEGNRGLYDGADEYGTYSTAELARALSAPVLLCVDCSKTARTAAALLLGLTNFEEGLEFCGVVLNRVASPRHERALVRAIETATDLKVLGAIPRDERLAVPERHMGLASLAGRAAEWAERAIERAADVVRESCDLAAIEAAAKAAPPLDEKIPAAPSAPVGDGPAIGYVLDDALWFYYPENLAALKAAGARTRPLSLLDDSPENAAAWEGLAGLYLGGGFPEDFAAEIAASPFLERIRRLAAAGAPIYAECGGLIILCRSLEKDGKIYRMAGALDRRVRWHPRPLGLGYVQGQVRRENPFFPRGLILRGHEFHYSGCVDPPDPDQRGLALSRGEGLGGEEKSDGLIKNNVWAAFAHIFAPALPIWATNFVRAARVFAAREIKFSNDSREARDID